jgi:hypothetical protein
MQNADLPKGWRLDSYLDPAKQPRWDAVHADGHRITCWTRQEAIRAMHAYAGADWRVEERTDEDGRAVWAVVWDDGFRISGYPNREAALERARWFAHQFQQSGSRLG